MGMEEGGMIECDGEWQRHGLFSQCLALKDKRQEGAVVLSPGTCSEEVEEEVGNCERGANRG